MRMIVFWLYAYGASVVASGLYNRVVNGGVKGLWFGLCMGGMAIAGALLLSRGRRSLLGIVLASMSCAVVAGWFSYEAFVRHAGTASARIYLMILASLVTAVVLWRSRRAIRGVG